MMVVVGKGVAGVNFAGEGRALWLFVLLPLLEMCKIVDQKNG